MHLIHIITRIKYSIVFLSLILVSVNSFAFAERPPKPEFPYKSMLPCQSPENRLPIHATKRILKERENFLGLKYCNYQIEENTIVPYNGIIQAQKQGHVLIVLGYHYLEKPWGRIFKNEFQKNISDPLNRILFLEIQNNDILTGDDSPTSNREIREFLQNFPHKVNLIIEIHEHLSDSSKFYGNDWPPYWYQLDNRTGGDHSIKYTILDPYIPWFCIRDYFESNQQIRHSEMQKAINETLRHTVMIINEVLAESN